MSNRGFLTVQQLFAIRNDAMPIRFRRIFSLLLIVCGFTLLLRPAAALSSSSVVLISEFMPNTGADLTTPEWVELFNPNPFSVDVAGWKIVDDTISHPQTTIGAGSVMLPNSLLVVFLTTNILNNTGSDAVQLLDLSAVSIDSYAYT